MAISHSPKRALPSGKALTFMQPGAIFLLTLAKAVRTVVLDSFTAHCHHSNIRPQNHRGDSGDPFTASQTAGGQLPLKPACRFSEQHSTKVLH